MDESRVVLAIEAPILPKKDSLLQLANFDSAETLDATIAQPLLISNQPENEYMAVEYPHMFLPNIESEKQAPLFQPTGAGGLLNLQLKFARIKKTLKGWNNDVFGNIHSNLRNMEEEVALAQANFEADPSPGNRANINKHSASYILILSFFFFNQKRP